MDFDPDFISGKKTKEEILVEFLSSFGADESGIIVKADWDDYYKGISSSFDTDD